LRNLQSDCAKRRVHPAAFYERINENCAHGGTPTIASRQVVCSFNPPTTNGTLADAEANQSCTVQ